MGRLIFTSLLFLAILGNEVTSEEVPCPRFCICDIYEDLNRANCSHQRLVNAYTGVSNQAEILDLSHNSINIIDNTCFQQLPILKNLTLSFNSIHTIYLESFKNLQNVKYIDLSYNRLEFFDNRILETNRKLEILRLEGNKFMSLQSQPLLINAFLQTLYLNNAQVSHIYPSLFSELPSLVEIDISQNLLITLPISAFSSLKKLKFLNISNNRWECDKSVSNVVNYFSKRNVKIDTNCVIQKEKTKKFERLIVETSDSKANEEEPTTSTVKPLVQWKSKSLNIDNDSEASACHKGGIDAACKLYDQCMEDYRKSKDVHYIFDECDEFREHSFYTGIVIGAIATIVATYICWEISRCILRCINNCNKQSRRRTESSSIPLRDTSIFSSNNVRLRRPPRSRRPRQQPRRPGQQRGRSNFKVFVTSLFERPARRRYYRSASNLVRRLSQTNLFRASRYAQPNDTQNSSTREERAQLIEPTNETVPVANQNNQTGSSEIIILPESIEIPTAPRGETPPPAYADIAH